MCTSYGNLTTPKCKAYQGTKKVYPLTTVFPNYMGGLGADTLYIGDPTCGFDGYLKGLVIAKDGNILDSKISNKN